MSGTPNKAARIRELYATGKCVTEIAHLVGCDPAYVRVCARQRTNGGLSLHDRRYNGRIQETAQAHPECLDAARNAYTSAYREARAAGAVPKDARLAAVKFYYRVRRATALAILRGKEARHASGNV